MTGRAMDLRILPEGLPEDVKLGQFSQWQLGGIEEEYAFISRDQQQVPVGNDIIPREGFGPPQFHHMLRRSHAEDFHAQIGIQHIKAFFIDGQTTGSGHGIGGQELRRMRFLHA